MGDEQVVKETSNSKGENPQHQSYSRNYRQSYQGTRRQRWTEQPADDRHYNHNSRNTVEEQYQLRPASVQYEPHGASNNVDNFRGKRSSRGFSGGRYRGNNNTSSRYKGGSRYVNDVSDFGSTESCTDKNISSDRSINGKQFSESSQLVDGSQNNEEQNADACDRRGYVVSGRYMRKSASYVPHSEKDATCSYNEQNYRSNYKTPERANSKMNSQEKNLGYSGFQRSNYPQSSSRESYNVKGYNYRGRQKTWYGPKVERRSQTPDLNENIADATEDLQSSAAENSIFKPSLGPSYKSSYQKDRNSANEKFHVHNKSHRSTKTYIEEDEATQRDRLIMQLHKGECECMVCCESIRSRDQIWHCSSCYHVFHLRCIRKWARSPAALVEDSGWRCPACQNISSTVPFTYYCFCGKHKDPEISHHLTPHSCGEVCRKERPSELCPHPCNILCHPGPCPPCTATITRNCGCGKTKKTVPCRQQSSICCSSVCDKLLNCGVHHCESICHSGDCEPCSVILNQVCFCGKVERQVPCTEETSNCTMFLCDGVCGKKLDCDHHYCEEVCHPGPCGSCALLPSSVDRCPCGKTPLKWLFDKNADLIRKTCVDPIPACNATCDKVLKCGPKENRHSCNSKCHSGECPPCSLSTVVKCRCGAVTKELPCVEYVSQSVILCEKRCSRRKDCGRHKCLTLCCVGLDHVCELVCNKKLSCGTHFCEEKCHMGNCPQCKNVSFDELPCHCGVSVLYPPIHCGTKPPECQERCIRPHQCEHPVQHNCHSEETCPPCTALTVKWCFGRHMQRKNVQCFLEGISCGLPCDKPLSCKMHKCQDNCHEGPCLKNGAQCTQLCSKPRPDCDHPCGAPCHEGPCPDIPCKAKMNVSCPCGNRTEFVICSDNSKSYHLVSMSMLASKIQDIKLGQSVNMSDVLGKKSKLNRLQCNEECAVLERNKRLAVALQIQNPDLSCKPGPPNYSEFLKDEAKKSPQFVFGIYEKLTELVHLAKESKKKSRSHAFPPMNRDQRRVIHELAEFFGCESQSYDEEPKKSVSVTAFRDKSWLPFVSILAVVQREMGHRKGPTPVITHGETKTGALSTRQKDRTIDYFDFKEDS